MDWSLYDEENTLKQSYLEIDERLQRLKQQLSEANLEWQTFQELYDISWIYHENGLEGVILTYPEIKSAISNTLISDVSLLETYNEIKKQKYCIDLIREKAKLKRFQINVAFLQELHAKLTKNSEEAKSYRRDIPIHRTYFHEIIVPHNIPSELVKVLDYLKEKPHKNLHPLELTSNFHHRFMHVFPFSGTSGLIGRLLLNFILLHHGYLPVIIHTADRQTYYEALRGPERNFREFLVEALSNALDNALHFVGNEARKRGFKRSSA